MMDEIGFLSCLLSVTLTLYDYDGQARAEKTKGSSCLLDCGYSPGDWLSQQCFCWPGGRQPTAQHIFVGLQWSSRAHNTWTGGG